MHGLVWAHTDDLATHDLQRAESKRRLTGASRTFYSRRCATSQTRRRRKKLLPLAIAGTGYGVIGILVIILLVVLIVYFVRRA